jgi:hypothetical protein
MKKPALVFLFIPLFLIVLMISGLSAMPVSGKRLFRESAINENNVTGNIAIEWMSHITNWAISDSLTPPPSLRMYAYAGLTMYESQLPSSKDYQSLYTYFTGNKIRVDGKVSYFSPACVNAGVAQILRRLQSLKKHGGQIDSLEMYNYNLYKQQCSSEQLEASVAFGKQVADSIFEWSKSDGSFTPRPAYTVPVGPGLWEASPGKQTFPVPVGAYQGVLRTFCTDVTTKSDPGPPPPFSTDTSSVFYKDAQELMKAVRQLSHDDSVLVNAWMVISSTHYLNTMTHMTLILTAMMEKENYPLQTASAIYAKNGMAMFDAVVCSFKTKYVYNVLNPVTYINKYLGDTSWVSYYFYNYYPAYPSNQQALVAASGAVMESQFGSSYHFTDTAQALLYGLRSYNSIDELVDQVGRSRIIGGVDFRFSVNAAKIQGRKVGTAINNLPFKKLP